MKASQRARLAGISSMVAGALIAGGSTLTIEVDAELLPFARDIVSSMVGGEQDSLTQLDDRDVYRWTVEPTRDRDVVAIQLVWPRPERKAERPVDNVIALASRRPPSLIDQMAATLRNRYGGHLCGLCKRPWSEHEPGEVISHSEEIQRLNPPPRGA